jgi:hypothetical protein
MTTLTHGLKGKFRDIVRDMDARRSNNKNPRNIGLRVVGIYVSRMIPWSAMR